MKCENLQKAIIEIENTIELINKEMDVTLFDDKLEMLEKAKTKAIITLESLKYCLQNIYVD